MKSQKEVAYAMNNFYRSSQAKEVLKSAAKKGEVVETETAGNPPYSETNDRIMNSSIEDFPDYQL